MFAKHGDHNERNVFKSDADVKRYMEHRGIDFEKLVDLCRNFKENVPYFENLVGSTWSISAGCKAAVVDKVGGKEKCVVEGPGTITLSTYWAHAETAYKARTDTVEASSFTELQTAIVSGMASIEAYINHRAELWNNTNPKEMLADSFTKKVSFDEKVDVWIPKMTGGTKLDKGTRNWMDFQELKKIRDNVSIHSKVSGMGTSFAELAKNANIIRTGISGLLIQLHILFKERIPSVIIRFFFAPEAEVVEFNNDKNKPYPVAPADRSPLGCSG
ncbi:MAG: hypothetical protein Q8O28_06245 [Smithellaceae bacterium]|nr:hypothetical protein [Smithellaceae bacterium]